MDNFSWVVGKHSLRMGGEYRYNQFPQLGNEFPRGQFFIHWRLHRQCQHSERRVFRRGLPARATFSASISLSRSFGDFRNSRVGGLFRRYLETHSTT